MNLALVAAVFVTVVAALFAWGLTLLRRHNAEIEKAFAAIDPADIPALAGACSHGIASRLKASLDSSNPFEAAAVLDTAIRSKEIIDAFAKPDVEWAYAIHVGAYLGELVRMHAGGEWRRSEDGAPELIVHKGEAKLTLWPFEKVLKHRSIGEPGDLVAYLEVALRNPDEFAAEFTGTDSAQGMTTNR